LRFKFGVIADDFTGANDVGVQFEKRGLETIVLTEVENLTCSIGEVIVVDTESRACSPDLAYSKVREAARALKDAGIKVVYKKIDSTLRGNIGSELDAVMDEVGVGLSLVAPAFPANKRVTVGGRQLVNGKPLEETSFAQDPINPIRNSHVPSLIQAQTKRKVGHVALPAVSKGPTALKRGVREQLREGKEIIVVDATTRRHLETIAEAAADLDALPCGSAGLAGGVSRVLQTLSRGPVLVISGSVNETTLKQIQKAEETLGIRVVDLNPIEVLRGGEALEAEKSRVFAQVNGALEAGDAIVRMLRSKEHVAEAFGYGKKTGLPEDDVVGRLTSFLGGIIEATLGSREIAGLVLTGGETAFRTLKEMGGFGAKIEGEVLAGVPSCRLMGGRWNGLRVVTKAGGFGNEEGLITIIKFLRGEELK